MKNKNTIEMIKNSYDIFGNRFFSHKKKTKKKSTPKQEVVSMSQNVAKMLMPTWLKSLRPWWGKTMEKHLLEKG